MLHIVYSLIYSLILLTSALASDWDTYPAVPKTASVNGFADPIASSLPSCAQECVEFSVSNTPCPYWDTGCLCMMPQWSGQVAECIVSSCTAATDVAMATSAAYSLCSSVGADLWMMPASLLTALQNAASITSGVTHLSASSGATSDKESLFSLTASTSSETGGSSDTASPSTLQGSANEGSGIGGISTLTGLISAILVSLFV